MAAPTPGTTPGLPTARQRWRGACRRRRSMTRLRDGHRRRHRARRRVPRTRCTESPTKFLRLASYGRSTPLPFPMIICCQSTIESEFFSCFFSVCCCIYCQTHVASVLPTGPILLSLDCRAPSRRCRSFTVRRRLPRRRRNRCFWLKNDA